MDDRVHTILEVLGDGGTTDMAQRVATWLSGGGALGVKPDDILGRREVAGLLGKTPPQAAKLLRDSTFPAPFRTLDDGTELYDSEQVGRWIAGNPDLVGGGHGG